MANLTEEQRIHIYLQESQRGILKAGENKKLLGYPRPIVEKEMQAAYEICLNHAFPVNPREKRKVKP